MSKFDTDLMDARKATFIKAYSKTGVIQPALDAAGISRTCYKHWRKKDPDFHLACSDAYEAAVDAAEVELRKRGVEGYDEPVLNKGEQIWCRNPGNGELILDADFNPIPFTRPVKSDRLLEVYTRSHRPIYKERFEMAITGADGGKISSDVTVTLIMPKGKTEEDYPEGATPKMDHETGKPVEPDFDPLVD